MVRHRDSLEVGVHVEQFRQVVLDERLQSDALADVPSVDVVPDHPGGVSSFYKGRTLSELLHETVSFLLKAATEVKATVEDFYARDSSWLEEEAESVATGHLLAVSVTCNKGLMFMISTMYFSEAFLVNLKLWAIETTTASVFTL